ncbi:ATPase [Aureococcus anophagefferens]|nr:ATPase [Aureococcus anophagefferens]
MSTGERRRHTDGVSARPRRRGLASQLDMHRGLEVDRLTFSYTVDMEREVILDVPVAALRQVGFRLPAACRCVVAGGNGAGKSTLLRLLAGRHTPESGSATFGGDAAGSTALNGRRVRRGRCLGRREREFRSRHAPRRRGGARAAGRASTPWPRLYGWTTGSEPGTELSDGERRKVQLFVALAPEGLELVLLDEACVDLDALVRDDLMAYLEAQRYAVLYDATPSTAWRLADARPRPPTRARDIASAAGWTRSRRRTREQELAKTGRIVDYERDATLTGVRKMISDLEGPSDPNPFILAIRAAFDVKRKGLYATSPTAWRITVRRLRAFARRAYARAAWRSQATPRFVDPGPRRRTGRGRPVREREHVDVAPRPLRARAAGAAPRRRSSFAGRAAAPSAPKRRRRGSASRGDASPPAKGDRAKGDGIVAMRPASARRCRRRRQFRSAERRGEGLARRDARVPPAAVDDEVVEPLGFDGRRDGGRGLAAGAAGRRAPQTAATGSPSPRARRPRASEVVVAARAAVVGAVVALPARKAPAVAVVAGPAGAELRQQEEGDADDDADGDGLGEPRTARATPRGAAGLREEHDAREQRGRGARGEGDDEDHGHVARPSRRRTASSKMTSDWKRMDPPWSAWDRYFCAATATVVDRHA